MYTDSDQTFPKQRSDEETWNSVGDNYGFQATVSEHDGASLLQRVFPLDQGDERPDVAYIEQLQQRIKELEAYVHWQNGKIQKGEVLERNYEATLRRLARMETKTAVLVEDREQFYNESQFYKRQAEEKTRENDKEKERIREVNICLLEVKSDKRELELKIRDLERHLLFFQEKYDQKKEEETSANAEDFLSSRNREDLFPTDSGIGTEIQQTVEADLLPRRKRRNFYKSLTVLPRCKNCMTVFDKVMPHEIDCNFHRSLPQPLKAWSSQQHNYDRQFHSLDRLAYKFWPCCEKVGLKEPPGCLRLRSHDIVNPEDE